ncbi:MAG TPA: kelch repeat-containing protein [Gemmatimonadales bacterium]
MRSFTSVVAAGLLVTLSGCDGSNLLLERDGLPPQASVSDGANAGNKHFFFLPPMVPAPSFSGVFDGALSPVVQICEWTGSACVEPLVAEFTSSNGPGSETVRVVPEDEHYIVNWHTGDFNLDPARTYRIAVLAEGTELGYADVDVVNSGKDIKNLDTGEFVPLLDGRTLPIKFRIEEGAITPQWIQLSPSGELPSGRRGASGVLDAAGQLIVFGGELTSATQLNDLWRLANADGIAVASWTKVTSAQGGPPSPRSAHSAVYDISTDRMILYGGYLSTTDPTGDCSDQVWVLANASGAGGTPEWTKLSPSGSAPVARGEHTAVYDGAGNRLIIYGGNCGSSTGQLGDVWVLTGANGLGGPPTWSQLSPTGTPPAKRDNHAAVYDAMNNRMIVFGGRVPGGISNEVWVLSGANGQGSPMWQQLSPSGAAPAGRGNPSAVYDPLNNRLTVFGGEGGPLFNDVWVLANASGVSATPSWQQLAPLGTLPAPRRVHVAVYSTSRNRMTIFAGIIGAGQFSNDAWVLTHANGR